MRKYLILASLALIVIAFVGCSKDATKSTDGTVHLYLSFPDDPLIANIDYIISNVTAAGMATPIRDSAAVAAPVPGGHATVDLVVPAGNQRLFTIQLYDDHDIPYFWVQFTLDIANRVNLTDTMEVVQAGFGAATRIKLFRDGLPWDSYAMDSMLADNGFTPGTGDNQYLELASTDFDTVTLVPGTDLVIISNDQDQTFYNNYFASQDKINQFVFDGGTIFWEACDLGWANGSKDVAGIVLPGGVLDSALYDPNNYITSSELLLVAGLDSTLTGNYASHEAFYNLADGTISYTVDSRSIPTLITYNHGLGWVFATGQPLEYNYDRIGSYSSGYLLPRVVRFLLGLDPAPPRAPHYNGNVVNSGRSSASAN
jgi:hypothetical protein